MEENQIWIPLLLTLLAGLSTGLGSLFALFIGKPKMSYMCIGLGLSTGIMIYVSFVELLETAIETIGFLNVNLTFFAGILFLMIIDFLVPHNYIYENFKNYC